MSTEAVSPRYRDLDTWTPREILEALLERQFTALATVQAALPAIEAAALAAAERLSENGRLAYAGAGTSGRIAVQDGVELVPTFSWPEERLVYFLAGGEQALVRAIEGAEDDEQIGRSAVSTLTRNDVLIALAASGTSPFTLGTVRGAKHSGALTIALTNNQNTPFPREADHLILLDTGPEVIAGSTRLSAGTAQKAALNLLSTLLMVRLGRVYGNRMVELKATNAKLHERAQKIVRELTGATAPVAAKALQRAGGRVSLAVLLVKGLDPYQGQELLLRAGNLREALKRIDGS